MRGSFEEHACKLVIRLHRVDLRSHHREQACFQCFLMLERGHGRGEMSVVQALIEGLDQIFLRVKVVVSVASDTPAFWATARMVVSSYPRSRNISRAVSRISIFV